MNRSLLVALAVVGAATAYLQTQGGDDDLVAKPGNGGARARHETRGPEGDAAPQAGHGRPDTRAELKIAAIAPWAADALVQGAQAWQARGRAGEQQASGLASGATSAWAAATPPPAPVLRPPPPTEVVVVAPPAPTAPRFPHPWVGRFNDGAVLSGPDTTWVVKAGDVIEGQWRVDRVDERRMSLTYLPLNLTQQVVMR